MGSLVVTYPSSWQLVIAKHFAHAPTILQSVFLCMFWRSSCVVSVDAVADCDKCKKLHNKKWS